MLHCGLNGISLAEICRLVRRLLIQEMMALMVGKHMGFRLPFGSGMSSRYLWSRPDFFFFFDDMGEMTHGLVYGSRLQTILFYGEDFWERWRGED